MAINTTIAALLLLTLSIFSEVIELALMFSRDGEPLNSSEEATALFLLSAIVTMTIFALSVIIMTMEELKIEYQEYVIFDPTTTILNERTFIEACNRALGVALRQTKPVSVLTLELTNIDDIIKKDGVQVGNAMLRHFALMSINRRRRAWRRIRL